VSDVRWSVGKEDRAIAPPTILNGLFATISYRLEPNGSGTRFPVTMNQLRFGHLDPAKAGEAAVEIDSIARELKALSPQRAVWNLANPRPMNDRALPVNRSATNIYDYFCTSTGRPILSVVREMVEQSRQRHEPIRESARPPTVPVRKALPIIACGAVTAVVAYLWYPTYIITPGDYVHHGPLIWLVGVMVFILGCASLGLDRISGFGRWTERIRGLSIGILVVMLCALGYLSWR
jgi:2,3-bisphosphoglycerate-dependent phosphoglycerate mutase